MKIYKYLVLYLAGDSTGERVWGRAQVTRDRKIKDIEDLEGIEKIIEEKKAVKDVIIISWQKF